MPEHGGATSQSVPELRAAVERANVPALLMALVQLTGDRRWLEPPYRPVRARGLDDNDSGGLPPDVRAEVLDAVVDATERYRAGELAPRSLSPDEVARMLAVALDEDVPREYGGLLAEELGLISRDVDVPPAPAGENFRVIVIGAGLSGLCAAIKLKAAGVPYTVVEKNDAIGGTWLENTYPGCGVDTPAHLYCFSFAHNTTWTRYFAKRDEVRSYLEELATRHGIHEDLQLGTEVIAAAYVAEEMVWRVRVRGPDGAVEEIVGNVLVPAVGMVNRPSIPGLDGLDRFTGPVMHTAQWDTGVDLTGKRVAVIGTGASAMQLVPSIADTAAHVRVFQRSKQWALPHPNYQREVPDAVRLVMDQVPFYAAWYRLRAFWNFSDRLHSQLQIDPGWAQPERSINASNEKHRQFLTRYIESELGEHLDELRDACVPDYPPYGKRPLIDNGWYRTMCRDDVDLVTEAVTGLREHSVVTASGAEFDADVVVFATGFRTLQFLWPMEIRGRSGRTIREVWGADDARAYLGMTVPDFPNMFILNGPNTNAGHGGSAIHSTEFQVRYLMEAIAAMFGRGLGSVEVREDVFRRYNDELDEALSRSIWVHPGMTTYYRNDAGRVVVSSPWKYLDYWQMISEFSPDDYVVEKSHDAVRASA